jgi:hypothetical protein
MKCGVCYADNPYWQEVCSRCGEPVVPVRLCPAGHVLPPGSTECASCSKSWPEVTPFHGLPVLRAIVIPDAGEFASADGTRSVGLIELRDGEQPVSLVLERDRKLRIEDEGTAAASLKILTRPDGMRYCLNPGLRPSATAGAPAGYEAIPEDRRIWVGSTSVRITTLTVPPWVSS